MTKEFKERLAEIRLILDAPGEVFYGTVYESGYVSQRVVDAKEDMKFLLDAVNTLEGFVDDLEDEVARMNRCEPGAR